MFPPPHPVFLWWSDKAVFVALGYLVVGLLFLFIHKTRLMFVCFGCSAAICFFKNETSVHEREGPGSWLAPPALHSGALSVSPCPERAYLISCHEPAPPTD